MHLSLYEPTAMAKYASKSQRMRVLTESWFGSQMYCPNCLNPALNQKKNNTKAVDFSCLDCTHIFQLKSQSKPVGRKVVDGAFESMIECVKQNKSPDFFFMEYNPSELIVRNLLLTPRFFITPTIIEKRKPLGENARRAGWVGCNVLFSKLPEEARIPVIKCEVPIEPEKVQKRYKSLDFLDSKNNLNRGWISDILYFVHRIGKKQFSLSEIYRFESELKELHPENSHIRDKMRQQMQFLRDKGVLKFHGNGNYELSE
ncbi:MAG: restriction endonuclease [Candidatus Diapherotrites archaeon]|nr:restriction endonuclease [Candidatus Diapherotrites archaeon]